MKMSANPKTVTANTKTTADSFVKGIDHAIVFKFYQAIDANRVSEVSELLTDNPWLRENLNHPEKLLGKISPFLNYNQMCYLDRGKNLPSTRKVYSLQFDGEGRPTNLDHVLWFPSAAYPLFRAINTGNPDMVRVFLGLADPNLITPYDLCYGLLDGEFSLSKLSGKTISKESQKEILKLLIMAGYEPSRSFQNYLYFEPTCPPITRCFFDIVLSGFEPHGFDQPKEWADFVVAEVKKQLELKKKAEDTLNKTTLLIIDEVIATSNKTPLLVIDEAIATSGKVATDVAAATSSATTGSTATVVTTASTTITFSAAAGSASSATLEKPASSSDSAKPNGGSSAKPAMNPPK